MPRVNLGMSEKHKEIYAECLADYGKMMSVADVMDLLGYSRHSAEEWVKDLDRYCMNGKAVRYRALDVSRKLAEARL